MLEVCPYLPMRGGLIGGSPLRLYQEIRDITYLDFVAISISFPMDIPSAAVSRIDLDIEFKAW
jgi:hypothetical protein